MYSKPTNHLQANTTRTPEQRRQRRMNTDRDRLRSNFSDAIAPLAQYRRTAAWEYIVALEAEIKDLQDELHEAGEEMAAIYKDPRI